MAWNWMNLGIRRARGCDACGTLAKETKTRSWCSSLSDGITSAKNLCTALSAARNCRWCSRVGFRPGRTGTLGAGGVVTLAGGQEMTPSMPR